MYRILVVLLVTILAGPVAAGNYYVAPPGTVAAGTPDGSEGLPFASIPAAFASGKVKGGDTLLLKSGFYGDLEVKANAAFDTPVTIMSQTDRLAHFDSILISGTSRNLILQNLSVWPRDPLKGERYLVRAYATTSDITVDNLVIRSAPDAKNFMSWDAAKWEARKFSGILLEGDRSTAMRNKLTGVDHGVMVSGADSKILRNLINGYNGDGLRALGDRSLVKGNRVFNCVTTNENHDDGFQSFAGPSGVVKGLVLDSNIIIEWTGAASHPLRCQLQGIGLFDGFYDDLVITNNLISATAYHGIAVYGGRRVKIVNNTVVNGRGEISKYPWIGLFDHKNGTPSSDALVANNLGMTFLGASSTTLKVTLKNNSVIGTPGAVFEGPLAFDYRPKSTSGYIDTADAAAAPPRDLLNQRRPGGVKPDRGAYETQVGAASASMQTLLTDGGSDTGESTTTTGTVSTDTTGAKWIKIP